MPKVEASAESAERCPLTIPYQSCNIQTVQAIIKHGANVNAVNNRNQTALWLACSDGREDVVKLLLDTGADPTITDTNGDSSLHAAIDGRCTTVILQQIIVHGVHVNNANNDSATPLLLACGAAQTESVKLLLKAKADPNIADADGDTSLHEAVAANCSKGLLQEIISCGAEMNAVNKKGVSALLLGCCLGHTDSVEVLLNAGADPTILDEVGYSCLFAAVDGRCSTNILQALIDRGAHIGVKRKDGTNALLCACRTKQSESVRFLLEAGADVNISTPDGNTCLHVAVCGNCSKDTLRQIIQHGVCVNAVNKRRETALILACSSAQVQNVNMLLENGADPNISDSRDCTSLHAAVYGCCTNETLRAIISHNAHLDAQNINGETALALACFYRQQDSIKILLEAGTNPNIASTARCTSLHLAVFSDCSKKIIRAIIDHGADVNAANEDKVTALMIVSHKDNIDTIKILLKAGADPTIADANGCTCLNYAIDRHCSKESHQTISGHDAYANAATDDNITALKMASDKHCSDAISVLLNAEADINNTDVNGKTCLMYAIDRECIKETLQAIVDHGADVNVKSKDSMTALMIACWKGNTDAIDILLNAGANPRIANAYRDTCLAVATDRSVSKDLLQALIDNGAYVNATNKQNLTALMIACWKGNVDAIHVLLKAGADSSITNANGDTCLTVATDRRLSKDVLQAIIDNGADVNATNKQSLTALMLASWKGYVGAINLLLTAGADPNIALVKTDACLTTATVRSFSKKVPQKIIHHDAGVNVAKKSGVTAVWIACHQGDVDAINVLLNAGADSNIAHANGDTCLKHAIDRDCSGEVLQTIIDHGADVNAINKQNSTALMSACRKRNEESMNILLNAGADPNIADAGGHTCLHFVVHGHCRKEVLQALIDHGAEVNAVNKHGLTVLMIACWKDDIDAMNLLLDAGADPNIALAKKDACRPTVTDRSCVQKVLQDSIDCDGDVNAANKSGVLKKQQRKTKTKTKHKSSVTALWIACHRGEVDAINVLLNARANPNIVSPEGNTCLHHAVHRRCCKEIFQALIDHGVDVNATNNDNETALLMASRQGTLAAMNALLDAGADPNIGDEKGNTCLIYATGLLLDNLPIYQFKQIRFPFFDGSLQAPEKDKTNKRYVKTFVPHVLLNESANPKDSSTADSISDHLAVYGRYCNEEFQALINYNAEVNALKMINETALLIHQVFNRVNLCSLRDNFRPEADCKKILLKLIDNGADMNVTNSQNKSALMVACYKANLNVIKTFLGAKADPTAAAADGNTCLHYAVLGECSTEAFQILIDHGADINAANKQNQTALELACQRKNADAVNVLLTLSADPNIVNSDDGCSSCHRTLCCVIV